MSRKSKPLTDIQLDLLEQLEEFMAEKSAIKNEYEQIRLKNIATKNEFNPIFRTGIRENIDGIGEYLQVSNDVLFEKSMKVRIDSLKVKESDLLYNIYVQKIPRKYVTSILGIKITLYNYYLLTHTSWYKILKEYRKNVKFKEKNC